MQRWIMNEAKTPMHLGVSGGIDRLATEAMLTEDGQMREIRS